LSGGAGAAARTPLRSGTCVEVAPLATPVSRVRRSKQPAEAPRQRPEVEEDPAAQYVGSHLAASSRAAALTRLELALMRCYEALCGSALEIHKNVGGPPLSWQDVALLHSVRLRGGAPTLTDMLVFLHRHDLAALQYSFRKLETAGLVNKVRGPSRRERAYAITEAGVALTDQHSRMRGEVTVALAADIVEIDRGLHVAATVLERLIGLYDQATAAVLNGRVLRDSARRSIAAGHGSDVAPSRSGRKPA
jgi:predicted MarR family transcription regulator